MDVVSVPWAKFTLTNWRNTGWHSTDEEFTFYPLLWRVQQFSMARTTTRTNPVSKGINGWHPHLRHSSNSRRSRGPLHLVPTPKSGSAAATLGCNWVVELRLPEEGLLDLFSAQMASRREREDVPGAKMHTPTICCTCGRVLASGHRDQRSGMNLFAFQFPLQPLFSCAFFYILTASRRYPLRR